MTKEDLKDLLLQVQQEKCETQTLELKSAQGGCPKKLYDTLSSFSNQEVGGVILFGVDETLQYEFVGVYDPQDLIKQVTNQCNQMEPPVRGVFTTWEDEYKILVSCEVPGIDLSYKPCFYKGAGRLSGSYIRVGGADFRMTELEIYEFEAYRSRKYHDSQGVLQANPQYLQSELLEAYVSKAKKQRPNLSNLEDTQVLDLLGIYQKEHPSLFAWLLFSVYPQATMPQLCINASSYPSEEVGVVGKFGERFLDSKRIDGTIEDMLKDALSFVEKNSKTKIIISETTGERVDKPQYPLVAVREAILNALIHRDYSHYSQNQPIQLQMFPSKLVITNPGGLYGRLTMDKLGEIQSESRNPSLISALELLGVTENRYSGIPTIRGKMKQEGHPEPKFESPRDYFSVTFYSQELQTTKSSATVTKENILEFCETFKTRTEMREHFGISSNSYLGKSILLPYLKEGWLEMEYPEKPKSKLQRFRATYEI